MSRGCNWWNFSKELQAAGRSEGGGEGRKGALAAAADAATTSTSSTYVCMRVCLSLCALTGNMREFDEQGNVAEAPLPALPPPL